MHIKHDASNLCVSNANFLRKKCTIWYSKWGKEYSCSTKIKSWYLQKPFIPNVVHKWNELLNVVIKSSSFCQFSRGISNIAK